MLLMGPSAVTVVPGGLRISVTPLCSWCEGREVRRCSGLC